MHQFTKHYLGKHCRSTKLMPVWCLWTSIVKIPMPKMLPTLCASFQSKITVTTFVLSFNSCNTTIRSDLCRRRGQEEAAKWRLFIPAGLSTKYPIMGLETGWRCHLSSRVEVGFHRSELSGARILNNDGESLRYAILQNRKFPRTLFSYFISLSPWTHTSEAKCFNRLMNKSSVMRRKSGMIICGARVWKCTRRRWVRRS